MKTSSTSTYCIQENSYQNLKYDDIVDKAAVSDQVVLDDEDNMDVDIQKQGRQGIWSKRYRAKQKDKSASLESELAQLYEQIKQYKDLNSNLRRDYEKDEQRVHQLDTQVTLNAYDQRTKFETPKRQTISTDTLIRLDLQTVQYLYLDFYELFNKQLQELNEKRNQDHRTLESIKYTAENFNTFMKFLQVDNFKVYEKLFNCDLQQKIEVERDQEQLDTQVLKIVDQLKLTDQEVFMSYLHFKTKLCCQFTNMSQLKDKFYQVIQVLQNQVARVFVDFDFSGSLLHALSQYHQVFLQVRKQYDISPTNDLQQWLKPEQVAQVVISSYPFIPCFDSLRHHYRNMYLQDNNEIF